MNNLTFKQYRNIDLLIFTALLVCSETITSYATNVWFDKQAVAISTTLIFICIIMMRWNWLAIIPALVGGLVVSIVAQITLPDFSSELFLINTLGNCFALGSLVWFKIFKQEDIRKGPFKLFFFVATAYILLHVGRWLVSLCFGYDPAAIVRYLGRDSVSLLFTAVVMLLMKNSEGMLENQKAYLFRLQREREEKAKEDFPEIYPNND